MASNATIIKVSLQIADMDRHYYQAHSLTVAQHPSETAERVMVRLLAFALNASDRLVFTRGISTDDEPDIWQKSLTGEIECWIELGQPSEKRIRKACGRAQRVVVYSYGPSHVMDPWWKQLQPQLSRFSHLSVFHLPAEITQSLKAGYSRNLEVQVNIQDGEVSWHADSGILSIAPQSLW